MAQSPADINDIADRLISEYGYNPKGAREVAERLLRCAERIRVSFFHWWSTGQFDDLVVEGKRPEELTRRGGLNPIGAFLTLDWLLREPEKAKAAMARGSDRITVKSELQKSVLAEDDTPGADSARRHTDEETDKR